MKLSIKNQQTAVILMLMALSASTQAANQMHFKWHLSGLSSQTAGDKSEQNDPEQDGADPESALVAPSDVSFTEDGKYVIGDVGTSATVSVTDSEGVSIGNGPSSSSGSFQIELSPSVVAGDIITIVAHEESEQKSSSVTVPEGIGGPVSQCGAIGSVCELDGVNVVYVGPVDGQNIYLSVDNGVMRGRVVADSTFLGATSNSDGMGNTQKFIDRYGTKDTRGSVSAPGGCSLIGDEWFLPAYNALKVAVNTPSVRSAMNFDDYFATHGMGSSTEKSQGMMKRVLFDGSSDSVGKNVFEPYVCARTD